MGEEIEDGSPEVRLSRLFSMW